MRLYFCLRSAARVQLNFVPVHKPARSTDVHLVEDFVNQARKLLVITGAGLSTESGIPDYRSEGVGLYARTDRRPIQYNEFFRKESARQRYWARNYVGWPLFSSFQPNESHAALSKWEKLGKIHWLVTQNVDALHHKAGSSRMTELHGCSHRVTCLDCKMMMPRDELQAMFHLANPSWFAESDEIAPDADVQLTDEQVAGFTVPPCPSCGGRLKPDVIFFGDNVPRPKVDFVFGMVDECDRILVCGSSLHVYSAYRFVDRAFKQKKKIAVLNIGDTRADKIINAKISARCGEVLPSVNIQTRKS